MDAAQAFEQGLANLRPDQAVDLPDADKRAILWAIYGGATIDAASEATGIGVADINFALASDPFFHAVYQQAYAIGARVLSERALQEAASASTRNDRRSAIELARFYREYAVAATGNAKRTKGEIERLRAAIAELQPDGDTKDEGLAIRWTGDGDEGRSDPSLERAQAEGGNNGASVAL